jgi:hypothetical protein
MLRVLQRLIFSGRSNSGSMQTVLLQRHAASFVRSAANQVREHDNAGRDWCLCLALTTTAAAVVSVSKKSLLRTAVCLFPCRPDQNLSFPLQLWQRSGRSAPCGAHSRSGSCTAQWHAQQQLQRQTSQLTHLFMRLVIRRFER